MSNDTEQKPLYSEDSKRTLERVRKWSSEIPATKIEGPVRAVGSDAMVSQKWKVGDMALIAVVGGPRWVRVLHFFPDGSHCHLSEKGGIGYAGTRALLDEAGYLAHCEYMRDDWTGKEYREMRELARRPFVPPPWWEEALARAMEPFLANTKVTNTGA